MLLKVSLRKLFNHIFLANRIGTEQKYSFFISFEGLDLLTYTVSNGSVVKNLPALQEA